MLHQVKSLLIIRVEVLFYLYKMEKNLAGSMKNEMPDYTWKIILVGNKKVGKTSITNRFCNDTFTEEYKSS